jgi:ribonuclease HI
MQTISVYTDGSCLGNPGPGGWAVVILADGTEHPFSGGEADTTNNRMELRAAIEALIAIEARPEWADAQIQLHSDSQYVKNGITQWIKKWKTNGWKSSGGGAVKNRQLWEELDALVSRHSIEWLWVPGHEGVKYNEICDTLARNAASLQ